MMNGRVYWGVVVGVVILILIVPQIPSIRSFALFLTAPTAPLTETTQRSRGIIESLKDIATLRTRVGELEAANTELKSQLAAVSEQLHATTLMGKEAEALGERTGLTVRVIAMSPTQALGSIIVNAGERQGVRPGQAVLSRGFFIGMIDEVSTTTSRVNLISNPRFPIPVRLVDSRAQGLLKSGLTGFTITDIPANVTLIAEEPVLTSGLGNLVPDGLPVGHLGPVVSAQSEILQRADFESPIHFGTVEFVSILTEGV